MRHRILTGWTVLATTLVALAISFVLTGWIAQPAIASEKTTTSQTLLTNATTGSGVIGTSFMPQCRETAIYVQWSTGTTSGVVKVESAHDSAYTGTWAVLATDTWATENSEDLIQITGVHQALRARISTTVAGGTGATVTAVCN